MKKAHIWQNWNGPDRCAQSNLFEHEDEIVMPSITSLSMALVTWSSRDLWTQNSVCYRSLALPFAVVAVHNKTPARLPGTSRPPWQLAWRTSTVEPATLKMYTHLVTSHDDRSSSSEDNCFLVGHSKGETAHRKKKSGQLRINYTSEPRDKLKISFSSHPMLVWEVPMP